MKPWMPQKYCSKVFNYDFFYLTMLKQLIFYMYKLLESVAFIYVL